METPQILKEFPITLSNDQIVSTLLFRTHVGACLFEKPSEYKYCKRNEYVEAANLAILHGHDLNVFIKRTEK